jgi:YVTN family beta-propeller protein
MTKSLVEYVGAGVVIAGAGIWIAAAPAVAHAETDAKDAPSSSEVSTDRGDAASDHDADRDEEPDTDTASATEDDPTRLPDPVNDEPETPEEEPDPTSDDETQSGGEATPEETQTEVTPDVPVGGDDPVETPPAGGSETKPAEAQSDSGERGDASIGEDFPTAAVEDTPAVTEKVAVDRGDESREAEVVESEPTAAAEVAATPNAEPVIDEVADESEPTPAAATVSSVATVDANPVVTLLAGVLSFFGLNSPEAPDNPVGALVWGLFRRIETAIGVVPTAAQPTVSAPTAEGVVTGAIGFDDTTGLPLTYTSTVDPSQGTVIVSPDGSFTFTPTPAARLAAGAPGAETTTTFTLTASNGLAATNTVVTVQLSPYEKGAVITTISVSEWVPSVTLSPDGSYAYVTAFDQDPETGVGSLTGSVAVVDTATNTVIASIPVGDQPPYTVAFTPDGAYAYVTLGENFGGPTNNAVAVIDTATRTVITTIPVAGVPSNVVVTPDGAYAYVANIDRDGLASVAVINTATNTRIGDIPAGLGAFGLAIADTPNGTLLYVTDEFGNRVQVIDTALNIRYTTFNVGSNPRFIAVSPDGTRAYVGNYDDNGPVQVVDTATNTVVHSIPVVGPPSGVAVSPDGAYVYVATHGSAPVLQVIDTAANTVIGEPIPIGRVAYTVTVSHDGSLVYVANAADGTVSVIYTGNWVDETDV